MDKFNNNKIIDSMTRKKLNISFFVTLPVKGYSGGRYSVVASAEGLAKAGHEVIILTNAVPQFEKNFSDYKSHSEVKYNVCNLLHLDVENAPRADIVIVVPDLSSDTRFYTKAKEYADYNNSVFILKSFETPNWFNHYSSEKRDEKYWDNWNEMAKVVDGILCISKESEIWARKHYKTKALVFSANPPINDSAADKALAIQDKAKRIFLIMRFNLSKHKGSEDIYKLLIPELSGYTLTVLVGAGDISQEIKKPIEISAAKNNIKIEYLFGLNDEEKFSYLKSSEFLLFPSLFEGYGYPPVEALYCGIPVVCFDLPVIRDVCGDYPLFSKHGDFDDFVENMKNVLRSKSEFKVDNRRFTTVSNYAEQIEDKLQALVKNRTIENKHNHSNSIQRNDESTERKIQVPLKEFEKKHNKERCFIVGNGPSLNKIDMKSLKPEITLGSNRVYLGFKEWGYNFTYWSVGDGTLAKQIGEDLSEELPAEMIKFIPRSIFKEFNEEKINNTVELNFGPGKPFPKFSDKPELLYPGFTITYASLQLAAIMGCNPIYMVGVDHSYDVSEKNIKGEDRWRDDESKSHFCKDYMNSKNNQLWTMPQVDNMNKAYKCAAEWAYRNHIFTINLTPNSQLGYFPKGKFADLTNGTFQKKKIWFDITTLYFSNGRVTGVPKVVFEICKCFYNNFNEEVSFFVVDKDSNIVIVELSNELFGNFKPLEVPVNVLAFEDCPFVENDTVISIGALFLKSNFIDKITRLKDKININLVTMVYDIVPLRLPEQTPDYIVKSFTTFIPDLFEISDKIICISEYTKEDLINYCFENDINIPNKLNIKDISLGAETPLDCDHSLPFINKNNLVGEEYVLLVSTLYPRKNHELILKAFELLVDSGVKVPKLVLVTKMSPYGETVLSKVSENLARKMVILENVTDAELAWLYGNCMFTLYPSSYEGWGLPVTESFSYGKPCIALKKTSLIEAGGQLADFVDDEEPVDWAEAVSVYLNDKDKLQKKSELIKSVFSAKLWSDYSREIFEFSLKEDNSTFSYEPTVRKIPLNIKKNFENNVVVSPWELKMGEFGRAILNEKLFNYLKSKYIKIMKL